MENSLVETKASLSSTHCKIKLTFYFILLSVSLYYFILINLKNIYNKEKFSLRSKFL